MEKHKNKLKVIISLLALLSSSLCAELYEATWESVAKHTAAPEWFQDAKFGVYFHWGVYSVPAFGNEWYPRNMYNKQSGEYRNHLAKYGDPFGDWQYHNFINGSYDKNGEFIQFAPKLKSAGGEFDPDEWAELIVQAGAKFAGPVAEHHDGFSLWDSKVNEWNSMQKGPKLDLVGLFEKSFRAKGLKFIVTTHHAWNYTGYWEFPPVAQTDNSLKKLYGQLPVAEEDQIWYDKLKELIDNYKPDLIWHDLYLSRVPENLRLKFLAYYYNKASENGQEVIVASKDGFRQGEMHDYERGGPAEIRTPYWLSDDAVSSTSWCYTNGIGYYTSTQMIHRLIDLVSKNGNLMLNISPKADGSIPQEQKNILIAMGDWLKKFGESIYSTRAWKVYGEGPTQMGGGAFKAPVAGNNKDWRFTQSKNPAFMYAICLGWPGENSQVTISSITPNRFKAVEVYLLSENGGKGIKMNELSQNENGLTFKTPSNKPYNASAYVFKVSAVNIPTDGNLIQNGDFSFGETAWTLNKWSGNANGEVVNGEYKITINELSNEIYGIQLVQPGVDLEKGKAYQVKLDAYSSIDRYIEVNMEMANSPWTSYLNEIKKIDLTTVKKPYSFTFVMDNESDNNGRLGFNVGNIISDVFIDNVSVKEIDINTVKTGDFKKANPDFEVSIRNSMLNFRLKESNYSPLSLKLFNLKGDIVSIWGIGFDMNEKNIDLSNLKRGHYIFSVEFQNKTKNHLTRFPFIVY